MHIKKPLCTCGAKKICAAAAKCFEAISNPYYIRAKFEVRRLERCKLEI